MVRSSARCPPLFSFTVAAAPLPHLPVSLDANQLELTAMGASILGRRRQDMGSELDHDVHATLIGKDLHALRLPFFA